MFIEDVKGDLLVLGRIIHRIVIGGDGEVIEYADEESQTKDADSW
jgi:hypothetical protein